MVSNPVITLLQNVRALYNIRMIPYVCSLCDQVFSVSCSLFFFLQSSYSHYKPFQKQACFYRRPIDWGRGYGVIGSPLYSFRDLSGTHHDGIVTMLILS